MGTRYEIQINATHTPIHGDGQTPIERVRRLDHEWELADYEWNPETGESVAVYERKLDGVPEELSLTRIQPSGRWLRPFCDWVRHALEPNDRRGEPCGLFRARAK
jgi:hypothetical protein